MLVYSTFFLQFFIPFLIQIFQEDKILFVQYTNLSLSTICTNNDFTGRTLLPVIAENGRTLRIYSPGLPEGSIQGLLFWGTNGIFNHVFWDTFFPFESKRERLYLTCDKSFSFTDKGKSYLRCYAFFNDSKKANMVTSNFLQVISKEGSLFSSKVLRDSEVDYPCLIAHRRFAAGILAIMNSRF